ncbi:hypothetical protein ACIBF5_26615 [Micromonospora sp. NPDC050417]|uniref:hypothetical protein n=1 Tax=Micromonospora sp. NPDC050417 TaxID=3364280 RepID=UPI00379E001A
MTEPRAYDHERDQAEYDEQIAKVLSAIRYTGDDLDAILAVLPPEQAAEARAANLRHALRTYDRSRDKP